MKIAFDLRRIKNLGIGRYMKDLVEAILAHEPLGDYLLILPPGEDDAIQLGRSSAKTKKCRCGSAAVGKRAV